MLSLLAVIPAIIVSMKQVKRGEFTKHRNIQTALFLILTVVLILFELDLRSKGGVFEMTKGGRFGGTDFLKYSIYFHLMFSFSTAFLWILLIVSSWIKFARPPKPNSFSRFHRIFGKIAVVDLLMTAFTGIYIYVLGFHL